jgi:hypothetical protein
MRVQTDRFETVLPKKARFFSPSQSKAKDWRPVIITGIAALTLIAAIKQSQPPVAAPAKESVQAPAPPRLPDPIITPVPRLATTSAPRAQLLHIRPIGVFENDTMPDGRVLGTTYKGELANVASLPKFGQPGDMWYTRADGHCWVLAPIYAGSQTTGWVDP